MGDRAGSGVHRFVGYAEPVALLLGAVGIVAGGDLLVCLIPSGALIATIGVLIARNHDGLADALRSRHPRAWNFGFARPAANVTFGAALLTFVGLCWLALGVASLLDQL
jgi:hypothetical protein